MLWRRTDIFSRLAAVFLGIVVALAAIGVHAEDMPVARDARVAGDEIRTRFVMDLSSPIEFALSTLADPYRVIVDLPETQFQIPPDAGQAGRGLVSAWRFGLFAPGKSRIVLDADGPVSVDKAFVVAGWRATSRNHWARTCGGWPTV